MTDDRLHERCKKAISGRVIQVLCTALVLASGLGTAGAQATCDQDLTFTFWGSPQEKRAVEDMIASFNAANPGIRVRGQHIPTDYGIKLNTMIAGGTPPDAGYLGADMALPWAEEGLLLDLTPYFEQDPAASERFPNTFYKLDGKIYGSWTVAETMLMYYNKDAFDQAGLKYPPATAEAAWTWDEFVTVAKKLTRDRNGNDATSPDFDPSNIQTYGVSFPTWWAVYLPLIASNGGSFANKEGTQLLLNRPEAVEVLQRMQDLIYVNRVAPTPTQSAALPAAAEVMMQTGKVAMTFEGQWKVLDYSQLPGLNWSMGVLPYFKKPTTLLVSAGTVAFADTPCPDAVWAFYKFHNDPANVNLFKKGLWMPLQLKYYTNPTKQAEWLEGEPGVYPPEAKTVLGAYVLNNATVRPPDTYLKNATQLFSEVIDPTFDKLWNNQGTAQEVMDEVVEKASPVLAGRW